MRSHNRPIYLSYLVNSNLTNLLYFHNDPLSMKGSITRNERINLLKISFKIIFISEWVKKVSKKYKNDFEIKKQKIIYHSVYKQKKLLKKKKYHICW